MSERQNGNDEHDGDTGPEGGMAAATDATGATGENREAQCSSTEADREKMIEMFFASRGETNEKEDRYARPAV